jgi:hypothetical protein
MTPHLNVIGLGLQSFVTPAKAAIMCTRLIRLEAVRLLLQNQAKHKAETFLLILAFARMTGVGNTSDKIQSSLWRKPESIGKCSRYVNPIAAFSGVTETSQPPYQ